MSFQLRAPHPSFQTVSILPNPDFSDQEGLTDTVSTKRSLNGTLRTYVKSKNGRRKMQWTLQITRNKALELRAFIFSYFAHKVEVTDHNSRKWVGYFTNNPFEFEAARRGAPAISSWPVGETHVITLEFEGVEQP